MLNLRIHSARANAGTRARIGDWSPWRRLVYIGASPLFPFLRLRVLGPWLRSLKREGALFRVAPLLALALLFDAFGQAVGFAFGAGDSAVRAGVYDLDREPYLCAKDRLLYVE